TVATLTGAATLVSGGVVGSDSVTLDSSLAAGNFVNASAGNGKAVTVTGYFLTGTDAGNYGVRQPMNLTASINPKSLVLTGLSSTNKVYDGSTSVILTGGTLSGVIGADDVQLSGTAAGSVANPNAGINKAVSFTGLSLTGSDSSNYTLSSAAGISIDITPKPLTVASGLTATNKVYDGTRQATISGTPALSGKVGSDVVYINPASVTTALFADANAGTSKVVEVTGYTLTGAAAANYTLTQPVNLSADIQPKPLTLSGLTASSKVYNRSDVATLNGSASLTGVVGADIVNLSMSSVSARFSDANVGTSKPVAVSGLSLGGAAAGNYSLNTTTALTANITPKPITVTADAKSKTYGDLDPALTHQVTTGSL
ncbi:MAG: filamentous hemagglutinin, partial [Proteobacteria bacterium]|nr:filamentous hemagglutinin [Pseudomonadota bacterium]